MNDNVFEPDYDNLSTIEEVQTEIVPVEQTIIAPKWVNSIAGLLNIDVAKPRDVRAVMIRCAKEADIAGEACYYGWKVQDKKSGRSSHIGGPSIVAAMIALRNWGNSVLFTLPIEEDDLGWTFNSAFIDLETKQIMTRPYRISKKFKVYGDMTDERKEDIRFQIGTSKCQRNLVLRSIPNFIIDEILQRAYAGVSKRLDKLIEEKGIEHARQGIIDALEDEGISLARVELKLGLRYKDWEKNHLILLRGDIKAIRDGMESAEELYPRSEEAESPKADGQKKQEQSAGRDTLINGILDIVANRADALPKGAVTKYAKDRLEKYRPEALASLLGELKTKVDLHDQAEAARNEQSTGNPEAGKGSGEEAAK